MVSEHIHKSISRFIRGEKKRPSSERAYFLQKVCDNILGDQKYFKKILGVTKLMTIDEIREIYDTAYGWKKNPPALFWKLIKEKNIAIKKEVENEEKLEKDMEKESFDSEN